MKKLKELRESKVAKLQRANELLQAADAEKRELTEQENTEFETLTSEIDQLDKDIAAAEKQERIASMAAGMATPKKISETEERDIAKYSFMKVLRSQMPNAKPLDGLEREMHEEGVAEARSIGQAIEGVAVSQKVFQGMVQKRDMTAGTGNQGGFMVQTEVEGSVIEALRPRLVLAGLGANLVGNLVGNIDMPSSSGVVVGWGTEIGAISSTSPTIGRVQMSPKRLAGYTPISKQLLIQTSGGVETMIRNDFFNALAAAFEAAAINGGGSNEPVGILATAGIGSVVGGTNGAAPTWKNIVDLEAAVAIQNADQGALAYLTNPKVRGKLKDTAKDTGSGIFVWPERASELNGYAAGVTSNVPSNLDKGTSADVCSAIIFGNFNDLILGNWGGVDVVVDPYTAAKTGEIEVVVAMFGDVGVRRAKSFAAMLDALTA